MAVSLLLTISAALGLGAGGATGDERAEALLRRGWQAAGRLPCPGAEAGTFFEIESEDFAAEAYVQAAGRSLVSRAPLPGPGASCRKIEEPHFIEEIP